MQMNRSDLWKNFRLGEELDVSGTFIYNGLRRFHELKILDHSAEIFEILYQLSVGIERLMKITIVMLEHNDEIDQEKFEKSLITHNHEELVARIRKHVIFNLDRPCNAFLKLLARFYKNLRYDRFSLKSPLKIGQEKQELFNFFERYLKIIPEESETFFAQRNTDQNRKFLHNVVTKISSDLYLLITQCATTMGLYTYELRSGSKAETIFLGQANIPNEDLLLKELLIFFMNTKESSSYLSYLRSIEPLSFDPGLVGDYLHCFQSESARAQIVDEMETLYCDIPNSNERIEMMKIIGDSDVYFDDESDI